MVRVVPAWVRAVRRLTSYRLASGISSALCVVLIWPGMVSHLPDPLSCLCLWVWYMLGEGFLICVVWEGLHWARLWFMLWKLGMLVEA